MTSVINSAARPVSFRVPAARDFRDVIRVKVGTTTAETPAARVRKERRDAVDGTPWASVGSLVVIGWDDSRFDARILALPLC
jgi:hypothetical protein